MQTIEETELKMPSDFRWHSFLVSAGYLPDTVFIMNPTYPWQVGSLKG